ncbi:MAG: DUF1844 domain-containing protein [Myxococcota bacterium]
MADSADAVPSVSFSSFVVSLATSAMNHLGEGPGAKLDMPMARHTVDLLGLLMEKTKGNLDDDEQKLLETVLYDVRMKFLERSGEAPT